MHKIYMLHQDIFTDLLIQYSYRDINHVKSWFYTSDMNDLPQFSFPFFVDPGAQHQAVMVPDISLATMLHTEGTMCKFRDANCRCRDTNSSYVYIPIITYIIPLCFSCVHCIYVIYWQSLRMSSGEKKRDKNNPQ